MYLKNTRPDICFAVNTLTGYLVQPKRVHLISAKHVMRYLKGTIDLGLYYDGSHDYRLYGHTDADWAGTILDRKSTLGRCFCLGSAMISWFSRKQSSVVLSTVEVEYIAAWFSSCEAIWIWKLMSGLFNLELDTTVILCDNQSCVRDKMQMMMFQYSHTEDIDDVSLFAYCRCRWWWFRISVLNIEMMMLSVFLYWRYRWWWF